MNWLREAMAGISLVNALVLLFGILFAWMMYRFNKANGNTYNVVDMLVGTDGRASVTNHILIAMALLSVWTVIDRELAGKDDVSTILLGVLGVFVAKQAATQITEIINRPEAPSTTTTETNVKTVEKVESGSKPTPKAKR